MARIFRIQGLVAGLAVALLGACGTKQVCSPGDTRACLGAGQCAGAQICLEAGTGFSACDCGSGGGGGGGAGGGGGNAVVVRGAAQKGPFVVGSSVSVAALDATGVQTGQVFLSQTSNDRGEFELTVPALPIAFVELEASGFHFNEVTGALSGAELTLRSIAPLDGTSTYLNVLTHLATNRIRTLAAGGSDLALARTTAEQELRAALPVGAPAATGPASGLNILGGDTDANAYLFAISVVFAQAALTANPSAVDAELQQLLNTAALDFADGAFDPTLLARLEIAEEQVIVEQVEASFERRLSEIGSASAAPDLDRVIDSDGDGTPNAADPCPLQAGTVPSTQFCMHAVSPLAADWRERAELAAGSNGASVVISGILGGDGGVLGMQWLSGDGGVGPATRISTPDGGRLFSGPFVTSGTRDGSGQIIVGLLNGECASVAFVSPSGATRIEQLGCGAREAPRVFQSPSGAMYAVWVGSTPINSTWYAWSSGGAFSAPILWCTECGPAFASNARGDVAVSMFDSSVVNGGFRLFRSDGDGGWTNTTAPSMQAQPAMTLDSNGNLRALWTTLSGSPSQLNWATHDGTTWSATSPVVNGDVHPWPVFAGNGAGWAIAAFSMGGQLLGSALPTDAGAWQSPHLLATDMYAWSAVLSETRGAVMWVAQPNMSISIARYDIATGWGASQVLRARGEPMLTFVDDSTLRLVWRELDAGVSTALLR